MISSGYCFSLLMKTGFSAACDDKWCASLSRALLRHGITIWVDVPIDIVAREIM